MLTSRHRKTDPLVEKHSETECRVKELSLRYTMQFKACINSGLTLPSFGEVRSDVFFSKNKLGYSW